MKALAIEKEGIRTIRLRLLSEPDRARAESTGGVRRPKMYNGMISTMRGTNAMWDLGQCRG